MATRATELAKECQRQSETCLYTSTSLFLWLRLLRWTRFLCVLVPLVLGPLASWKLLANADDPAIRGLAAVFAFVAGVVPTVYAALKPESSIGEIARLAGEFKNLQDRFRQAAQLSSRRSLKEFDAEFAALMERLDRARAPSVTAPEFCFRWAQRKISKGDYSFQVDDAAIDAAAAARGEGT